jgi:protein tyrosine phosphatase (PTP) superfamily phosphohydrolase (DUF442 family)
MDAPETPPVIPPAGSSAGRRLLSRRNLFRLAGAGAIAGVSLEAARVFAGSNEHTVIPGKVYRSAQPTQEKLQRVIAEKKIRTVINLRGCCPTMPWYLAEAWATHATGVSQEDITLSAKRYPHPGEIGRLIEVFDRTDYPVLIHCAAGADRTGLASAIALLLLSNAELAAARRQLWPRYGHFAIGRPARLDEFLDYYENWLAALGERHSVEAWTFSTGGSGGIQLRYSLYTKAGAFVFRGHAGFLARTVHPGESIELVAGFPPLAAGPYMLHTDMLDEQSIDLLDTDFSQYGSEPLIAELTIR